MLYAHAAKSWAKRDYYRRFARRMLRELPDARLHPLRDCGHVPLRECPVELVGVSRLVAAFFHVVGVDETVAVRLRQY